MSFFFNDTATTEIYTLSLHDALPILGDGLRPGRPPGPRPEDAVDHQALLGLEAADHRLGAWTEDAVGSQDPAALDHALDRKSTRLNSSHANISYAVFCLKKRN